MTSFDHNEIDHLVSQAEALLLDEQPVEALAILEHARALEPHHGWVMLFRGVALGQLGRLEEAIDELLVAADEHADDIDIQVDAARHLSLLEQHQDALICANRAVELEADDSGAHAARAEALERMTRIEEAIPNREEALALDPEDTDSRYFLAVDLCDTGRYDEAYNTAEPLFAQFPEDADIVRLHGACLSYLGRHQEALTLWAELERLEGVTANLLHNRASTLDVLGRHEEALVTINECIAMEPEQALNYYTRGMIQEKRLAEREALDDYLTALQRDPHHLDAAINMVELATIMNAMPAMLTRIDELLIPEPNSAELLYARGRLQVEMGDFEEGIKTIEQAVCREPSLGIAWYTLSMLYGSVGEADETIITVDRALRHFPDDPSLWLNRGQALHELKQFPEAMACYDKAAELAPEESMPWLHLGRILLLDLNRAADARGALQEALRLQPDNDNAAWMLALCYLRLGRLDDAGLNLQGLLKREPRHLWGRLVRAALRAQTGKLSAAFADLAVASAQGYDTKLLLQDPLFAPLWHDPRFQTPPRKPRR